MDVPVIAGLGGRRRVSRQSPVVSRQSSLAVERQEHEAEHVDGGEELRDHAEQPQHGMATDVRAIEDLVLAEEAGEERHARDRQRADDQVEQKQEDRDK